MMASKNERRLAHKERLARRRDSETVYSLSPASLRRIEMAERVSKKLGMDSLECLMTYSDDELQAILNEGD